MLGNVGRYLFRQQKPGNCDSGGNTHSSRHTYTCCNAHADTAANQHANADAYTNSVADGHTDVNANAVSDPNAEHLRLRPGASAHQRQ
jgi:hypothetical protein